MNHQEIENDDVVERYLLGQLSPDAAERFEAHYLGCQDCLDRLELAEALIAGAKTAAAAEGATAFGLDPAGAAPEATPRATPTLPRRRLAPVRPRHLLALAAVLALAIGGPLFLRQGDPGRVAAVLDLERGDGPAATRVPAPASDSLVLALQLTPPLEKNYTVKLYRVGHSLPIHEDEDLEPQQERLVVALPAALVAPGEYLLRLQDGKESELGTYRFATAAAAAPAGAPPADPPR